jgi:hypothetical protein
MRKTSRHARLSCAAPCLNSLFHNDNDQPDEGPKRRAFVRGQPQRSAHTVLGWEWVPICGWLPVLKGEQVEECKKRKHEDEDGDVKEVKKARTEMA